jgi:hypothetical protein
VRRLAIAAAAFVAVQLAPAQLARAADDEEWSTAFVKDKKDAVFDPAKAYILVESPGAVPVTLFKYPTSEERAKDDAERDAKIAEEHEDWVKDHARWEQKMERFEPSPKTPQPPIEPIEPTVATFAWQPLELRRMVSLGPLNRFSKSEDVSLYVQEVPPGEYVYYGAINLGLGVCACMGTVRFDAVAGKVTTLRYDYAFMDKAGNLLETDRKLPEGVETNDAITRLAMILTYADEGAADPRIPPEMLRPADFTAMPMLPNWLGTEINRIQPIPGVLEYERGNAVDVKARSQAATARAVDPQEPPQDREPEASTAD